MKVTIEFDLPEGQATPKAEDIVRLTSPDWHSEWWHIEDVQSVAEDLTDDEAREVLRLMAKYSDCNVGINWETIEVWADIVRDERPEVEDEWEVRLDDSGESEKYGEGRWFISNKKGEVLADKSFKTQLEANIFLDEYLESENA
jgi:hypothetical protein